MGCACGVDVGPLVAASAAKLPNLAHPQQALQPPGAAEVVLRRAVNVDTGDAAFDKAHRALFTWVP